jgi:hypothetical protein
MCRPRHARRHIGAKHRRPDLLLRLCHQLGAAELAIISHHGSLADADLSYAKLGSYATTHEISIDGPLREYYLRGAADTPDEAEWRTEIGWPIFRADVSRA